MKVLHSLFIEFSAFYVHARDMGLNIFQATTEPLANFDLSLEEILRERMPTGRSGDTLSSVVSRQHALSRLH